MNRRGAYKAPLPIGYENEDVDVSLADTFANAMRSENRRAYAPASLEYNDQVPVNRRAYAPVSGEHNALVPKNRRAYAMASDEYSDQVPVNRRAYASATGDHNALVPKNRPAYVTSSDEYSDQVPMYLRVDASASDDYSDQVPVNRRAYAPASGEHNALVPKNRRAYAMASDEDSDQVPMYLRVDAPASDKYGNHVPVNRRAYAPTSGEHNALVPMNGRGAASDEYSDQVPMNRRALDEYSDQLPINQRAYARASNKHTNQNPVNRRAYAPDSADYDDPVPVNQTAYSSASAAYNDEAQVEYSPTVPVNRRAYSSASADQVPVSQGAGAEYNILMLGETGVGKSTFINAFANYLTYQTLDDALAAGDIISLIPTKFTVTDDNFQPTEIVWGMDENECFNAGASATQMPKIYKFSVGNSTVRIIDTPGIGDTRGIEKDEKNFDNLLIIISQLQYLHAICILLKPNNSRLTVLFEYCIKQLLSRLERSAVNNIVFLFTNSRNTFYRPGDTLPPLLRVLEDVHNCPPYVKIPFCKDNVFCLDNEAFRFLLAKRQGVEFSVRDKEDFDASWNKSADSCASLLEYITKTKPHKIQDTISVNEARRLILTLSEPLAIAAKNVEDNMRSVAVREMELKDNTKSIEELKTKLYVPVIKVRTNRLDYPRTVCAHPDCTQITIVENVKQIHYKKACHDPCKLKNVTEDVVGTPNIRGCDAFDANKLNNCRRCSHIYTLHLHIYYTTEAYSDSIIDRNVNGYIQTKQQLMEEVRQKIGQLHSRMDKLHSEKEIIQTAMADFTHYLKNSAIAIYNDKYKEYIELLINREKSRADGADRTLINTYEQLIRTYEEKKKILDRNLAAIQRRDATVFAAVTTEQIITTVQSLFKLEINGPVIKQLYQTMHSIHKNEILNKAEHTYQPNVVHRFAKNVGGMVRSVANTAVNYFRRY